SLNALHWRPRNASNVRWSWSWLAVSHCHIPSNLLRKTQGHLVMSKRKGSSRCIHILAILLHPTMVLVTPILQRTGLGFATFKCQCYWLARISRDLSVGALFVYHIFNNLHIL